MNTTAYAKAPLTVLAPWVSGCRGCWVVWPPVNWVSKWAQRRASAALVSASAPALLHCTSELVLSVPNNMPFEQPFSEVNLSLGKVLLSHEDSWQPSEVPVWWGWWSSSSCVIPCGARAVRTESEHADPSGSLSQRLHQQQLCRQVNTPDLEMATSVRRRTLSWYFEAHHYLSSLGGKDFEELTDGRVSSKALIVCVDTWERGKLHPCCLYFSLPPLPPPHLLFFFF